MPKKANTAKVAPERRYRDALTGRFVTRKYAKKHKKTTTKEARSRVGTAAAAGRGADRR
jgi:hypothetical protein